MRVLVSGYLGAGNLGDEAIFAGLARGLEARGHVVTALSAAPAATRAEHAVVARHRLRGLPWALGATDALVAGGGGLLQDATSRRSLAYYLGVIRAARATGARVAVFAQSVGPLSTRGRRAVGRALADLPIAVRDEASRRLLAEVGLDAVLVADTALALPLPPVRRRGGLLLVPRADVPGARGALEAVAREAVASGTLVGVLPLQRGADEADADGIAAGAPGVERRAAAGPEAALARCAEVDTVVSVRLHGLILALRAGRAHVGVGYDPKVAGFAEQSGARVVPVPVDPATLRAAVAAASPPDEGRRRALLRRAEEGLDWLDAALRASGARHGTAGAAGDG